MNPLLKPSDDARIHIVGIAPGASALDSESLKTVSSCDVLILAERHLSLAPDFAGRIVLIGGNVAKVVERAVADKDVKTAFLASGDPGFFGLAKMILDAAPRSEVKIHPAVSSMQLAFARIKETWNDARFISLHGRPLESLASVLGAPKIGVFTDSHNSPSRISQFLIESGWDDLEMAAAENLGLPSEKILIGAPSDFVSWDGSPLNIVLLFRRGGGGVDFRGPGIADSAFSCKDKMITKSEVRSVALGLLKPRPEEVLWDVGAGSASMAIEASLLAPGLRAYALEKDEESFFNMRENKRRLRAAGVVCLHGAAPQALDGLPRPDSVFIGGTGGDTAAIIDQCWTALKPGGTIVASCVLIETLCDYMAWVKEKNIEPEIVQAAFSRSSRIGDRRMLKPGNSVMLFKILKPENDGRAGGPFKADAQGGKD